MNDACELIDKPRRTLNIGLHAYECLPGLVFVKVPNERGRWLLVERCVAEVDCSLCGAVSGEPCHNRQRIRRYGASTHVVRRDAWKLAGGHRTTKPKPKIRLTEADYLGAYSEPSKETEA